MSDYHSVWTCDIFGFFIGETVFVEVTAYDNRLKSHIFDTFCWWWKENII